MNKEKFNTEWVEHILVQHLEARRALQILSETITFELQQIGDIANGKGSNAYTKRKKKLYGDYVEISHVKMCKFLRNAINICHENDAKKDLNSLMIFIVQQKALCLSKGLTLEEARDTGELSFSEHPKRKLQYLLEKQGEPEDLEGFYCCLFAGIDFYIELLTEACSQIKRENLFDFTISYQVIADLLHVERELGYIKEDIAKYTATSKRRIAKIRGIISPQAIKEVDLEERSEAIVDLIEKYKKEKIFFATFEEFKDSLRGTLKNYKVKKISESSINRALKRLEIGTKKQLLKKHKILFKNV